MLIQLPMDINMSKLCVFLPSIRVFNLKRLYDSISSAIKAHSFEMCVCSPYDLPNEIASLPNVKFIKDFGSPTRAAQLATTLSDSELLTLASDDGWYLDQNLGEAIDFYDSIKLDQNKKCVAVKYAETGSYMPPEKFLLRNHGVMAPGIPHDTLVNLGPIMSTNLFREIGGFDCENFELTCWGGHDLNIRLMNHGVNVQLFEKHTLFCEWVENPEGLYNDHIPIHEAHPLGRQRFIELYNQPTGRSVIPYDNWQRSPEKWGRRFS